MGKIVLVMAFLVQIDGTFSYYRQQGSGIIASNEPPHPEGWVLPLIVMTVRDYNGKLVSLAFDSEKRKEI